MSNATTHVVGYFNPNDYPMQIVVAEHNLTLHLKPKEWIIGREGAVVNDPLLDRYVGKGRLSRASDQTKDIPLVKLVPVNRQTPTDGAPVQYQHPVYSATGFIRDANGQMVAVAAAPTAPIPSVPPPVSYNPVKAMTIEQAKKLRLIKPVRQVNEDAGVPDTAGVPPKGESLPVIDFAHDTVREKPAPAPIVAAPMTPAQATIINTMQAAQQLDPDSTTFADDAVKAASKSPVLAPMQAPPPPPSSASILEKLAQPRTMPPPLPTNPVPTVMTAAELPDPVITGTPTPAPTPSTMVVEEDLGVAPTPAAATAVEAPKTGSIEAPKCPLCPDQTFSTPGYLVRHINKKHPERADAMIRQLGLV